MCVQIVSPMSDMNHRQMAVGQINSTRGPQILVHIFVYQGKPFVAPLFDPPPTQDDAGPNFHDAAPSSS